MSRTYRCRHLPTVHRYYGRSARKIVDGHGGSGGWKHRRSVVDEIANRTLGPRPKPDTKFVKWGEHTDYVTKYRKEFQAVGPAAKDGYPRWKYIDVPYLDYVRGPGHWIKTWEAFEWDRLHDAIERDYVWPTASWHPLARFRMDRGVKTYYKRRANKEMRRRNRQVVQAERDFADYEDWEGEFPRSRTYYNKRDMY